MGGFARLLESSESACEVYLSSTLGMLLWKIFSCFTTKIRDVTSHLRYVFMQLSDQHKKTGMKECRN